MVTNSRKQQVVFSWVPWPKKNSGNIKNNLITSYNHSTNLQLLKHVDMLKSRELTLLKLKQHQTPPNTHKIPERKPKSLGVQAPEPLELSNAELHIEKLCKPSQSQASGGFFCEQVWFAFYVVMFLVV